MYMQYTVFDVYNIVLSPDVSLFIMHGAEFQLSQFVLLFLLRVIP